MAVFGLEDFSDHEQVVYCSDEASGLRAIIAVHNSNLGPALGGCRMWPYESEEEALHDVLRLSRGMTYKSALAGLKLGGGKSVIIGDPRKDKTPELLTAFADALNRLGGRYIGAEDSGTSVADMKFLSERTEFVAGVEEKPSVNGSRSGDPSPVTAYGTFIGIRAAVKYKLGKESLSGVKVAIQGLGNVGFTLALRLKEAGAEVYGCDIFEDNCVRAKNSLGVQIVDPDSIYDLDVDVFSPCAMGASINDETIKQLKASIVAGAANNQLAKARHDKKLMEQGILYAPDYVVNAGGIIDVYYEKTGFDQSLLNKHVEGIEMTLLEIFERSAAESRPTGEIADKIAEERYMSK